jgi:6-pyruvoyltetrahydropterin/6-carboxytetrahydropterin synthase
MSGRKEDKMLSICKIFRFEAAHHLPFYSGKCHNLHGHSYVLEIEVQGGISTLSTSLDGTDTGMIMDFSDLKRIVEKQVIVPLDHSDLNTYFGNPTAEIMVQWIAERITDELSVGIHLVRVRLWETVNSYAEWRL